MTPIHADDAAREKKAERAMKPTFTYQCMGRETWSNVIDGKQAGFSLTRFPLCAVAQLHFRGNYEWWMGYVGGDPDRPIAEGTASNLSDCALAIDAARIKALRDLAEQLKEVE